MISLGEKLLAQFNIDMACAIKSAYMRHYYQMLPVKGWVEKMLKDKMFGKVVAGIAPALAKMAIKGIEMFYSDRAPKMIHDFRGVVILWALGHLYKAQPMLNEVILLEELHRHIANNIEFMVPLFEFLQNKRDLSIQEWTDIIRKALCAAKYEGLLFLYEYVNAMIREAFLEPNVKCRVTKMRPLEKVYPSCIDGKEDEFYSNDGESDPDSNDSNDGANPQQSQNQGQIAVTPTAANEEGNQQNINANPQQSPTQNPQKNRIQNSIINAQPRAIAADAAAQPQSWGGWTTRMGYGAPQGMGYEPKKQGGGSQNGSRRVAAPKKRAAPAASSKTNTKAKAVAKAKTPRGKKAG